MSPRTRRAIPAHNLKTTRGGDVKRRNIFWRWRRLFYLATLVGVVGAIGAGFVVSRVELPKAPPPEAQTTFICDASVMPGQCTEDNAMAELHGEEDRVNVGIEQIPDVAIDAVIAAEDRDFFEHGGVDPLGIARAAYTDIRGNSASRQGGSTITQQYVKNVYLTNERTLSRKINEAVMAVKLEKEMPKEQILENYLNTIYFGRGAYGIQAASQAYFHKNVGDLTLPDAALLAGLIRSPQSAEPYRYPEEARRRRRTVLDAMLQEEMIVKAERDAADEVAFDVFNGVFPWEPSDSVEVTDRWKLIQGEYFVEYVRSQLAAKYGSDAVFRGGLRVYTTIDWDMQEKALRAVTETLDEPGDPAGSLVAIDDTGSVRAMMGGTDFANNKVNLAVGADGGGSGRQPGSTFKTFALAEAMRRGYSIESLIEAPSTKVFPNADNGSDWRVGGGCCGGVATLAEATARSSNTAYAELMLHLGTDEVIDMAHELGIDSELESVPSAVLGTGSVSVLDMAAAYSTFANQGARIEPRVITRVERADGTVLDEFAATRTQVLSAAESARVTYALEGVIEHGTGEQAAIGRPAAGKTGTTQNNWDAWFAGYTPSLTAAVWMGYPEGSREMTEVHGETVQGGNFPARIWARFMILALEDQPIEELPDPGPLDAGEPLDPFLGEGKDPAFSGPTYDGPDETTTPGATTTPGGGTTPAVPPTTQPQATVPPATEPQITDPLDGTGGGSPPDG